MKIFLEHSDFGTYKIVPDEGRGSILIQTDWDYPGTAATFGWVACKKCGYTDGTVDCAHKTASQMIQSAQEYLDNVVGSGKCVDDPGYFTED